MTEGKEWLSTIQSAMGHHHDTGQVQVVGGDCLAALLECCPEVKSQLLQMEVATRYSEQWACSGSSGAGSSMHCTRVTVHLVSLHCSLLIWPHHFALLPHPHSPSLTPHSHPSPPLYDMVKINLLIHQSDPEVYRASCHALHNMATGSTGKGECNMANSKPAWV